MKSLVAVLAVVGILAVVAPLKASVLSANHELLQNDSTEGGLDVGARISEPQCASYLLETGGLFAPSALTATFEAPAECSVDNPPLPLLNGQPVPEPTRMAALGMGSLALAAASYGTQKRPARANQRVQTAVQRYLQSNGDSENQFRQLSWYLTTLASDPAWSSKDIETFYHQVVAAIHRSRECSEVA